VHVKKGIELLFEAWKRIHPDYSDWQLLVIGNGEAEYIHSLENRVESFGLKDNIKILPPVFGEAKIKVYQESSIFCLPSFSENFGMVIAEAMSCGTPVITTTNCPWEILNETNTGWCIDLSVDNLERALCEAFAMNPVDLYEMGQKASKLIYDNFDYRSVTHKSLRLYEWLLNRGEKPEFVYE
jgi:glycosyltransferase involved in cell wall biosynthesis